MVIQHVVRSSSIHHTIIYSYHTIYESEITNYFVPGVPIFYTAINLSKNTLVKNVQGNKYDW